MRLLLPLATVVLRKVAADDGTPITTTDSYLVNPEMTSEKVIFLDKEVQPDVTVMYDGSFEVNRLTRPDITEVIPDEQTTRPLTKPTSGPLTKPTTDESGSTSKANGSITHRPGRLTTSQTGPTITESGPINHETGSTTSQTGPTITESGSITHRPGRLTTSQTGPTITESGPINHETGSTTHQTGPTRNESGPINHETGSTTHQTGPTRNESDPTNHETGPTTQRTGPTPDTKTQLHSVHEISQSEMRYGIRWLSGCGTVSQDCHKSLDFAAAKACVDKASAGCKVKISAVIKSPLSLPAVETTINGTKISVPVVFYDPKKLFGGSIKLKTVELTKYSFGDEAEGDLFIGDQLGGNPPKGKVTDLTLRLSHNNGQYIYLDHPIKSSDHKFAFSGTFVTIGTHS